MGVILGMADARPLVSMTGPRIKIGQKDSAGSSTT